MCELRSWMALLPVSQRRNDKPFSAAQEFILVDEAHVCDVNDHLVRVLIEVETALLQPLKVVWAFDMEPALEGERVGVRVWRRDKEKRIEEGWRDRGKEKGSKIKGWREKMASKEWEIEGHHSEGDVR